jgi:hypothetical protein
MLVRGRSSGNCLAMILKIFLWEISLNIFLRSRDTRQQEGEVSRSWLLLNYTVTINPLLRWPGASRIHHCRPWNSQLGLAVMYSWREWWTIIVPNHHCGAMDPSAVMADLRWDVLVKWHSRDFFISYLRVIFCNNQISS